MRSTPYEYRSDRGTCYYLMHFLSGDDPFYRRHCDASGSAKIILLSTADGAWQPATAAGYKDVKNIKKVGHKFVATTTTPITHHRVQVTFNTRNLAVKKSGN